MIVKLLTEHHLEFLSFKGGCTGLSESTLVKIPHSWKSYVAAQMVLKFHLEHCFPEFSHYIDGWMDIVERDTEKILHLMIQA